MLEYDNEDGDKNTVFSVSAQIVRVENGSWKPLVGGVVPVAVIKRVDIHKKGKFFLVITSLTGESILDMQLESVMTIKKPSKSFCQWMHPSMRHLFGLNFVSALHATEFETVCADCIKLNEDVSSKESTSSTLATGKGVKPTVPVRTSVLGSRPSLVTAESSSTPIKNEPTEIPQNKSAISDSSKGTDQEWNIEDSLPHVDEEQLIPPKRTSSLTDSTRFNLSSELPINDTPRPILPSKPSFVGPDVLFVPDEVEIKSTAGNLFNLKNLKTEQRQGSLFQRVDLTFTGNKLSSAGKLAVRPWKKYHVILKPDFLIFFKDNSNSGGIIEDTSNLVRHHEIALGNVLVSITNDSNMKREYCFNLSDGFGQTIILQASDNNDRYEWMKAIMAQSALRAFPDKSEKEAYTAVEAQIRKLDEDIQSEMKRIQTSEYQARQNGSKDIEGQIKDREIMLDAMLVSRYQQSCYAECLAGSPVPSPDDAVAAMSKGTMLKLSRLGHPCMANLHALVSTRGVGASTARSTSTLPRSRRSVAYISNTIRGSITQDSNISGLHKTLSMESNSPSSSSPGSLAKNAQPASLPQISESENVATHATVTSNEDTTPSPNSVVRRKSLAAPAPIRNFYLKVFLPDDQKTVVDVSPDATLRVVLNKIATKRFLDPNLHFISVKGRQYNMDSTLSELGVSEVDIRNKLRRSLDVRLSLDKPMGFFLGEGKDNSSKPAIFITRMFADGLAAIAGLVVGDEIIAVNNISVSEYGINEVVKQLRDMKKAGKTVSISVLSSHDGSSASIASSSVLISGITDILSTQVEDTYSNLPAPIVTGQRLDGGDDFSFLIVPPPPSTTAPIDDEAFRNLVIPLPSGMSLPENLNYCDNVRQFIAAEENDAATTETASLVDKFVQMSRDANIMYKQDTLRRNKARKMSREDMRQNVIAELLETEKSYGRDLDTFINRYIQPLLELPQLITMEELGRLFFNIRDIRNFHVSFRELLSNIESSPATDSGDTDRTEYGVLSSDIGRLFSEQAEHFKLYSEYCAGHSSAQELVREKLQNTEFQEFLSRCNPSGEQSSSLLSFMMKPIQRLLKYPLLLRELSKYSVVQDEQENELSRALDAMRLVGDHVNEVTRIHDNAAKADELFASVYGWEGPSRDSLGDLIFFGKLTKVDLAESGKLEKTRELQCFLFKEALIFCKCDNNERRGRNSSAKFHFKSYIPLSAMLIRNRQDTDDIKAAWEVVSMAPPSSSQGVNKKDSKVSGTLTYILYSGSEEDKTRWMTAIKDIIKERILSRNASNAAAAGGNATSNDNNLNVKSEPVHRFSIGSSETGIEVGLRKSSITSANPQLFSSGEGNDKCNGVEIACDLIVNDLPYLPSDGAISPLPLPSNLNSENVSPISFDSCSLPPLPPMPELRTH